MQTIFRRGTVATFTLLFLYVLFQPPQIYAQAGIFTPSPIVGDVDMSEKPFIQRDRFVQVDATLVDLTIPGLQLNFFPDADYLVEQTGFQRNSSGSLTWFGKVTSDEDSQVILIAKDNVVVGNLVSDGKTYQIRYTGNDIHAVYEIDSSQYWPGGEPIVPEFDTKDDLVQSAATGNHLQDITTEDGGGDDGSIFDILVVYTNEAKQAAGGTLAMELLIDLAIAETNQAFHNSGITPRMNLVHHSEVAYSEAGATSPQHLERITSKTDGMMDSVHTMRDSHNADMVSLLVAGNGSTCGYAYVMQTPSLSFEQYAFSVVTQSCATGNYSFGHEIGHNLGLMHDRANSSILPAYPYGYGYQAPDESFRTIMSYGCPNGCIRVKVFSNPFVMINGQPAGVNHDTNPTTSANNALAIDTVRMIPSNWRMSGAEPATCANVTQIPQTECDALETLYQNTDGANWSNNTGWLATNAPCNWFGISCTDGHVTGLYLYNNQLDGPLPTELGNLSYLHDLSLYGNELSGSIPATLGNLSMLESLLLTSNELSGSIPAELGSLSNLRSLWLHGNQLNGSIPSSLGNLFQLESLLLGSNQLSGSIPSSLGNLMNLKNLWLHSNLLSGELPSQLGNLSNLEQLLLYGNSLSGSIPLSFTGLSALNSFKYSSTQLCEPNDTAFQAWLAGVNTVEGTSVCSTGLPDLTVQAVNFDSSSCDIEYVIQNIGNASAVAMSPFINYDFTARPLYVPAWGPGPQTGHSASITNIPAGGTDVHRWAAIPIYGDQITIFIDPQNRVAESNEANNELSFNVPIACQYIEPNNGDVNGDGTTNIFDLVILINMLQSPTRPDLSLYAQAWWDQADINNDGAWNVFDIVLLINVFD